MRAFRLSLLVFVLSFVLVFSIAAFGRFLIVAIQHGGI